MFNLQLNVDPEVEAFRDSARSWLSGRTSTARLRDLRDHQPGFERAVWRELAEAGWLSLLVPEIDGGLGLGLQQAAAIVEEIGRVLLPEPFVAAGIQSIATLCALTPSAMRSNLLTQAMAGELIIGSAWQEQAGELTGHTPATTSTQADGNCKLNGVKEWVVPGQGADGWLVTAMSAEGLAVHWVPADTQALQCDIVPRIDGSSMCRLTLQDTVFPLSHCLASGVAAQQAIDYGNDVARLMQAAELMGIARHTFTTTLDYLKTRQQFGKPIGANQALQHRMVDALIQLELASANLHESLQCSAADAIALAKAASRAKARCAHVALHITRLAVQFHGAMGYTDECDVGLYLKRAMHLSAWLGHCASHRMRYLNLTRDDSFNGAALEAASATPPVEFPREADWAAMPDGTFRQLVRGFFQAHYPTHLRNLSRRVHWPEIKDWYLTLSRQGWLAPAWPKAYGGMELAPDKLLAFMEEQEDYGVARMPDQGLINLGPVLINYGTPEQQANWLPKIMAGEHVWCQGYSEPNAGSDLASLRTEAIAEGDDFIVNGQKIWTTLAQDATHIFMLVRTDKTVKKQEGISFLLADLSTPGVTVRPIRNIAGEEEFCEVFFDNVRVPQANLVGGMNQGWFIAKALLGFERIFVGSPKTSQYALGQLYALAEARGLLESPVFTASYAELQLDLADLRSLYSGFADMVKRGEALPASVSMLKIWATETYTRISAKLIEMADEHGGTSGAHAIGNVSLDTMAPMMNALVTTIYGGTNEIQRNILSRQVLGLPN